MDERVWVTAKKVEAKKQKSGFDTRKNDFSESISSPIDHILSLQRTIGNQAVQRLFNSGVIQAKLKIGQPNDIYEQEADRVAEQVMRMPVPQLRRQPEEEEEELIQTKPLAKQITPLIQSQVEEEEEDKEEEEEQIQTKSIARRITPLVERQVEKEEEEETLQAKDLFGNKRQVTPELESRTQSMGGGGQPLPESTRAFFEPRFGHDFSQVRVHADAEVAQMNRELNAQAFTHRQDVFFGAGRYSPESSEGKRLLAHELTHVVQQKSAWPMNGGKTVDLTTERGTQTPVQIAGLAPSAMLQRSPLSEELEIIWITEGKGLFFDRLRHAGQTEPDVLRFIEANLTGDDLWLARNIFLYGLETNWPIHLRVEREMKGWSDSGGKGTVFDILRTADGAEASNADLTTSLSRVFAAGSDDLWLARNLLAHGPEASWPMSVFIPPGSATAKQVQFTANHPLTPYGSDRRSNALWTPGSTDHATAYTRGTSPA